MIKWIQTLIEYCRGLFKPKPPIRKKVNFKLGEVTENGRFYPMSLREKFVSNDKNGYLSLTYEGMGELNLAKIMGRCMSTVLDDGTIEVEITLFKHYSIYYDILKSDECKIYTAGFGSLDMREDKVAVIKDDYKLLYFYLTQPNS